jgi:TPR repeat protein
MATDLPTNPQIKDQYEYWDKQHDKGRRQVDQSINYVIFAVTILAALSNFLDLTWPGGDELPPPDATPQEIEALDDDDAFAWWMRAAEDGDPRAQYMVARSYRLGKGVRKDEAEAFTWYTRSADQGYLLAQIVVADYYERGGPIAPNINKAIFFHERAAQQGAVASAFRLYQIYQGADEEPVDRVLAFMWLTIAAEKGHGGAVEALPSVEAALTEAEYEEGRQRAEAWLEQY